MCSFFKQNRQNDVRAVVEPVYSQSIIANVEPPIRSHSLCTYSIMH